MENVTNTKVAIYWIVGIIVVIALFLGFRYWGNKSSVTNVNLDNNATTTENIDLNNINVSKPANIGTTTPKAPVKAPVKAPTQVPGFDYKG